MPKKCETYRENLLGYIKKIKDFFLNSNNKMLFNIILLFSLLIIYIFPLFILENAYHAFFSNCAESKYMYIIATVAYSNFIFLVIYFVFHNNGQFKITTTQKDTTTSKKFISTTGLFFIIGLIVPYSIYLYYHITYDFNILGWDTVYYVYGAKIFRELGFETYLSRFEVRFHSFLYTIITGIISIILNIDPMYIELVSPYVLIAFFLHSMIKLFNTLELFKTNDKFEKIIVIISIITWTSLFRISADLRRYFLSFIIFIYSLSIIIPYLKSKKPLKNTKKELISLVVYTSVMSLILVHMALLLLMLFITYVLLIKRDKIKESLFLFILILVAAFPGIYFYSKSGLLIDIKKVINISLINVIVTTNGSSLFNMISMFSITGLSISLIDILYSYTTLFRYGGSGPLTFLFIIGLLTRIHSISSEKNDISIVDYFTILAIATQPIKLFSPTASVFINRLAMLIFGPIYVYIGINVMITLIHHIIDSLGYYNPTKRIKNTNIKKILIFVFLLELLTVSFIFNFREASIHLNTFIDDSIIKDLKKIREIYPHHNLTFIIYPSEVALGGDALYHIDAWIGAIVGPHLTYVGSISFFINGMFTEFDQLGYRWVKIFKEYFDYFDIERSDHVFNLEKLMNKTDIIVIEKLYYPFKYENLEKRYLIEISSGIYKLNETLVKQMLTTKKSELLILPFFNYGISGAWNFSLGFPIVNNLTLNECACIRFSLFFSHKISGNGNISLIDLTPSNDMYFIQLMINNTEVCIDYQSKQSNISFFTFNFTALGYIILELKIVSKVKGLSGVGLYYLHLDLEYF